MLPFEFEQLDQDTGQLTSSFQAVKWFLSNTDNIEPVFFYLTKKAHLPIKEIVVNSTDLTLKKDNESIWVLLDISYSRPSFVSSNSISVLSIEIDDEERFWSALIDVTKEKFNDSTSLLSYSDQLRNALELRLFTIFDILIGEFDTNLTQFPGISRVIENKAKVIKQF